ncbi:18252_t:CDS:2 [Rhizophagus irregularis]|nr:18252_t:CDS:2 [Rhizophagus irregularis]
MEIGQDLPKNTEDCFQETHLIKLIKLMKSSGYNGKNRSNNSRKDKQQQSESSSIRSLEKLLDCSSSNNEARVQCFCGDSYDGGVGRHLGSEIVVLVVQE